MSSGELKPIVLYDIACTTQGRPWSPNTMVTRYCLGYKDLPFTTVWVEFPDIAPLLQSKGVTDSATTSTDPNGSAAYTLPVIEDPNTGTIVMDSLKIAAYLDDTWPDRPKVLSDEARDMYKRMGGALRFGSASGGERDREALLVIMVFGAERLNPVSQEFYHRTRTSRFGGRWASLVEAAKRENERAGLMRRASNAGKATWEKLKAVYDERPGEYVLGEQPCAFDFAVAGRIKYVVDGLGEVEKREVMEGRWGRLVESLEKYFKY